MIARNPALLDEAKRVAPELARRAQAIDEPTLLRLLVSLAPLFGVSDRSPEEWGTFFGHYLDALNVYPLEAIEEAILLWNRGASPEAAALGVNPAPFLPKPIDLSRLAMPTATRLRMVAYRAKTASEAKSRTPRQKSAEEIAADRKAAIDAGIFDENGKVILNFKTDESRRVGSGETRQQMADRLRRVDEEIRAAAPPPPPEEETV